MSGHVCRPVEMSEVKCSLYSSYSGVPTPGRGVLLGFRGAGLSGTGNLSRGMSRGVRLPSPRGVLLPSPRGVLLPSILGVLLPSPRGVLLPSIRGVPRPSILGVLLPSPRGVPPPSARGVPRLARALAQASAAAPQS